MLEPIGPSLVSVPPLISALRQDLDLPRIPYRRLRFRLTALEAVRLPELKGSTLRGSFGHALRASTCAMGPAQACERCSLHTLCAHARLFEPQAQGPASRFLRGLSTAPRPYVLEVLDERRDFRPGDSLELGLILLGEGVHFEPYAVLAVERLAARGLGRNRARFEVSHLERFPVALTATGEPAPDTRRVTLRFRTPARFKVHGTYTAEPSARELVFQMLRRVQEVAHYHVPNAAADFSFRPFLDLASRLEFTRRTRWQDWTRYSNRQGTAMQLGGFIGEMTLAGEITPFLPLFAAAEVLHVGKATTFGLGKVEVEVR